jgi:hypothetical protein
MLRCEKCSTRRRQGPCFKCGSKLFRAHKSLVEPDLPSIELIRSEAKKLGYAIAVHGSLERDLDLIAAPWDEEAIGNHEFLEKLSEAIGAKIVDIERKPHGRYGANLQMIKGWCKLIDISVMPRLPSA